MRENTQDKPDAYAKAHARKSVWKRIVTVLSCVVVFCTTYALILPAITASDDTYCGIAEHTHTEACYEDGTLVCTEAEHEHTLSCYSDPEADRESSSVWERSLPKEPGDNWSENILAAAKSQIGYTESEKNYTVQDGNMNGYTRYGDWYGKPYDGWSAMFVSFCLHYAGVPESSVPYGADCAVWADDMKTAELFKEADKYAPQPGDIVFFDADGDDKPDAAGVYLGSGTDTDGSAYIETIDGDAGGEVRQLKHFAKDGEIFGYCALPENPDAKSDDEYICGLKAHKHSDTCFGSDGKLVCGLEEHEHDDACAPETAQFEYEDSELKMSVRVESAESLGSGVTLSVAEPEDGAEPFSGFEAAGSSQQLILRSVSLMKNGQTLDMSDCRVIASVELKQSVLEPLAEEAASISDAAPESEIGIIVSALQTDGTEAESVFLAPDEQMSAMTVDVQDGMIALLAGASANPHYTVQYYAYIPRFASSGDKALTVFDTSGGVLPTNGKTNKTKEIYLKATGGRTTKNAGTATETYRVATDSVLTQMYSDNTFEYIKAPNTSYVNKLIDNDSYDLAEVWVLKAGRNSASTNRDDWNVYSTSDVHFTNREEAAASNIIYISEGTCIRLVYNCHEASFTTPSTFYDYDITSGKNEAGKWRTGITGINTEANYGTSRNGQRTWRSYCDVLAFGNANTGTGMANYKFDGIYLNKGSSQNYDCAFGIADSLSDDGKIVYNPWIVAPKLFNEGSANGKHTYENSSLTFSKVGDTYTLSSANVSGVGSINELQEFFHPSPNSATTHTHILTNDFWPLDSASNKTDPNFGATDEWFQGFANVDNVNGNWTDYSGKFPASDDGRAHNSFFGMQYAVKFTLTEDYLGPLEYYFFGDDDMWVFLDNRLVCDIGGVHSSVGEYVNLWDYLEKGTAGEHTLTFFYTERGASGSTCYMNFTLPSVSGVNIEQKTSELRISKTVLGEDDPTKEFDFNIRFFNSTGDTILDDYAYSRYSADGKELETDLIIHDGGSFKLRAGEYVVIKYLPYGLRYTVTESPPSGYTVTTTVNGIVQPGETATGTIIMDALNSVRYTNTLDKVGLTLQKLDPDGDSLSGAVFGLEDSAGKAIEFVSDGDGVYTAADAASTRIYDGKLYYIASAVDSEYVIGEKLGTDKHEAVLQKNTGSDAQKFMVYKQADGSYSFRNTADGRWLDLDAGGLSNGTLVHFWENASVPTAHDNQKWFVLPNGDGTFTIKPRVAVLNKSNVALDLNGATAVEGQKIQAWEGNNTPAQKWLLVPVEPVSEPETTTELEVGADGTLRLTGLLPGSYTLSEIKAPDGCVRLEKPITVHVAADGSVTASGSELVSTDTSGNVSIVKVTNKYPDRELTLEKQVVGSDTREKFEFTVSYRAPDGETVEKTVSLKNGGSEKIKIPYNSSVTITEASHNGFALSYKDGQTILPSDGDSCSFIMKQDVTVTAVNTAGYELPASGGPGSALYTAGGLLLIAAAGYLLYRKASKRRNESSS